MILVLCAVASILSVEILRRLGLAGRARNLRRILGASARVIRSARISDHWKERVLPCYAARLFAETLRIAGSLALFLLPFAGATALGEALEADVAAFLASPAGIAAATNTIPSDM